MSFWTYWAAALIAAQASSPIAAPPLAESPEPQAPTPAIPLPTSVADEFAALEKPSDEVLTSQTDYYERMTIPVTIEGQGPFRFMIDTGAQATAVTRGLTEQLNLKPAGSATVVGMGSRRAVQLVELNGLEFAERVLDDISAPMLEARNVGADGILGLDSLQDLRVMIDFRDGTIAVNDSAALGGNDGYEIVVRARHRLGRLIITRAEIDGVRTAVVLDTGAQNSFGNRKLQRRLRARNMTPTSSTDVNGVRLLGDRHLAKSLQIKQMQLTNMPITFADSPAFAALGLDKSPALILGMRDLRLFDRVAIDFATRTVLFDMPSKTQRSGKPRGGVRKKFFPTRL